MKLPTASRLVIRLTLAGILSFPVLAMAQEEPIQPTIITSDTLEMQGTPERNYFYFMGNVRVQGTNLEILCGELTVISMRDGPEGATIGDIGAIEGIIAQDAVEIHQSGRSAFAGRAEVDPQAGTVTLSDEPRIVDRDVEVSGYKFVLNKGEKKFVSIPDPNAPEEEPSRSVVRLGAMPDMGFDQDEEEITVDDQLEEPEEPALELGPESKAEETTEGDSPDGL